MSFDCKSPPPLLHFLEVESFANPDRGRTREERKEEWMEKMLEGWLTPSQKQQQNSENLEEWPRVSRVIRRGSVFVVEAESPQYIALLRFDLNAPERGDYQVRYRGRKPMEEGRTTKINLVADHQSDPRLAMLNCYENRFVVVTLSLSRPYTRLAWRVGFNEFRSFDELDQ